MSDTKESRDLRERRKFALYRQVNQRLQPSAPDKEEWIEGLIRFLTPQLPTGWEGMPWDRKLFMLNGILSDKVDGPEGGGWIDNLARILDKPQPPGGGKVKPWVRIVFEHSAADLLDKLHWSIRGRATDAVKGMPMRLHVGAKQSFVRGSLEELFGFDDPVGGVSPQVFLSEESMKEHRVGLCVVPDVPLNLLAVCWLNVEQLSYGEYWIASDPVQFDGESKYYFFCITKEPGGNPELLLREVNPALPCFPSMQWIFRRME